MSCQEHEWLNKIVCMLHAHGIVHRDLKPGNVMVSCRVAENQKAIYELAQSQLGRTEAAEPRPLNRSAPPSGSWTSFMPLSTSRTASEKIFPARRFLYNAEI